MKRHYIIYMVVATVVVLVLTGCGLEPTNSSKPLKESKRIDVEFVEGVDGDTAKLRVNGKVETVRFLLIDTPETSHPQLGKQPLGQEAKEMTTNLLENAKEIELEFDVEERDKYDRVLGYIYVDGESVQEELLKKGLARVGYIYESRRYLNDFREAENVAKDKKIGVWQCPGYVTDRGFDPDKWCKDNKTPDEGNKGKYIASKNSKVYHEVGCPGGANEIKPENAIYFDSEAEAKASGRRMCHSDSCTLN